MRKLVERLDAAVDRHERPLLRQDLAVDLRRL
jgi:hypothetical protein